MKNKKIAIFHNYMDNIGGAEIVCLILARELNADIYTTNIDEEKIKKMGFENILERIFSIGKVPVNPPFKQQIASWRFGRLNLGEKYDFYIIGGDWAMSGAINNKPNLWYVYSPIREIWDLYEYTREKMVPFHFRWIFDLWVKYNRSLNIKNIIHVNKIVSISDNVRKRVKGFLGRDSVVIYPPTETSKFHFNKNMDYWLSVNRLITQKRVELQLKAFERLTNENLIIVGSYEKARHFRKYAKYIKENKPKNVEVFSWVDFNKLKELYSNCKGFITTAIDEDYGMTPVEAMASGKPIIAPNEGGYKETIVNGKTGILIDNLNVDKLVDSLVFLGRDNKSYDKNCMKQAKKFDTKIFIKKIKKEIEKQI